jgi:transposase
VSGSTSEVETLRVQNALLEKQVERLFEKVAELLRRINELEGGERRQLELQLKETSAELERARRQMFGESSERLAKAKASPSSAKQSGHGRREQLKLPETEQVHELPEDERVCDSCGGCLSEWSGQEEVSPEITVQARSYRYVLHKRKKYRCQCGACIKTAPAPRKLRPGALYSIDFAIDVAVSKYAYHLPLERQVRMMAAEGLAIDSQTLWDQLDALAVHLEPTHQALRAHVLSQPVIGADETHWRLMGAGSKASGGKGKRWHVWAIISADAVSYQLHNSRSTEAAKAVLDGYEGTVLCDGYAAYDSLRKQEGKFRLAHCWAHVRRKFYELKDVHPEECSQVLGYIGQLYAIESELRSVSPLERLEVRKQKSKPIVDRIRNWSYEVESLPQSALRKALVYMGGMWQGLQVFLDEPNVELDNNRVERSLRGVVLGRKNHLGSRSERGTEVAALLYSLVESARLNSVDPSDYLRRAVDAALDGAEPLLPNHASLLT